ncbi:uncharacterized protein VTP21DRAFT_3732 [Calcarisporiella thermophila]|uniref:uncharacterized protein n=1 Tax=Calcarisporiella thermophila TaxID=911321 RepID=UPI00374267D2
MEEESNYPQNTSPVRQGHELDKAALEAYLKENVGGIQVPIQIRQFKHGQSNPTFFIVDSSGKKYVLRKKPPGAIISKTAHAVEREYRIIKALGPTDVPVPKAYCLCEDSAVIGTPFYIMEFLEGRIFTDTTLSSLPREERAAYWNATVDVLAKLHRQDYQALGLGDYGRPSGFYERQLRSLGKVSALQAQVKKEDGSTVGEIPGLQEMFEWFKRNMVKDEVSIVHGDFKLDNIVFHLTEPRVIGVLDWELSTIGHPLSDLANHCIHYYMPYLEGAAIVGLKGYPHPLYVPTVEEVLARYCSQVRRPYPISRWEFCVVFAFFRMCVITQGIAARVARKQASSAMATSFGDVFVILAQLAHKIIEEKGELDDAATSAKEKSKL